MTNWRCEHNRELLDCDDCERIMQKYTEHRRDELAELKLENAALRDALEGVIEKCVLIAETIRNIKVREDCNSCACTADEIVCAIRALKSSEVKV